MNAKKVVMSKCVLGLASVMLFSSVLPTISLATQNDEKVEQSNLDSSMTTSQLSNQIVDVANDYVYYDTDTNSFALNSSALLVLSQNDIDQINSQINQTNFQIKEAINDPSVNVYAVSPSGEEYNVSTSMLRANGVNSVSFQWNYARVKLSGNTLRNLGAGITLGGIWIPHPVASKVCSSLGVAISAATNGVWFDYNYAIGVLCGNFGWQ